MRFVLAHLLNSCQQQLHFRNLRESIPEYRKERDLELLRDMPSPRFIKSHDRYSRFFPKVIYIVRDPRDVYVSYFYYRKPRLPQGIGILEFVRDKKWRQNIDWSDHYRDWQKHPHLLLVRYEDLLSDSLGSFRRILEWTPEFNWNDGLLKPALEMSSFSVLKEQEQAHGHYYANLEAGRKPPVFMRQGQRGNWRLELPDEAVAIIEKRAGLLMKDLGY